MATHTELKELALTRLVDAQTLFREGRHDAAAYMCGYVLELALKACICRRLRLSKYPEQGRLKSAFTIHEFDDLLILAGLSEELDVTRNRQLFTKWNLVAGWKPDWRYRATGWARQEDVEAMLRALEDPRDGVLRWLKRRW